MNIESMIRILAGSLVLISILLSQLHSVYWLLLGVFVGINLIQSALTGWCLAESILRKVLPTHHHD